MDSTIAQHGALPGRASGFRATLWLAALGVLFQALLPLVSAAAPRRAPLPSQVVCSVAGVKLFHFGDEPGQPSDQQHPVRHCVLCSLGNATPALPGPAPAVAPALEVAAGLRAEPVSVLPRSILLFFAPPRAPPVLS